MHRGLLSLEHEPFRQLIQSWFNQDELGQRGFLQHFVITEKVLRMLHRSESRSERITLRNFFTQYSLFVTFEHFDNALLFGTERTKFAQFLLGSPPQALQSMMGEVASLNTHKDHRRKVRAKIEEYLEVFETSFQEDYRFTNKHQTPPTFDHLTLPALQAIFYDEINAEAMILVHDLLGYRLRWLIASATYLRKCFDNGTHPDWKQEGILPFPQALTAFAELVEELGVYIRYYLFSMRDWIDPRITARDIPRPPPEDLDDIDMTDEDWNPLFPDEESDPALEGIQYEEWGHGCYAWLEHLTANANATRYLVNAARTFKILQFCPPIKLVDFGAGEDLPNAPLQGSSPSGIWQTVLEQAFNQNDPDKHTTIDTLRRICDRSENFKFMMELQSNVAVDGTELEVLLMMRMAEVRIPSRLPSFDKTSILTVLGLRGCR